MKFSLQKFTSDLKDRIFYLQINLHLQVLERGYQYGDHPLPEAFHRFDFFGKFQINGSHERTSLFTGEANAAKIWHELSGDFTNADK